MDPREEQIRSRIITDKRPWGDFRRFTLNEESTVKVITVEAGQSLSLQRHKMRDELWIVVDPGLLVQIDEHTYEPEPGDEFVIVRGQTHRLASRGPRGRIVEVAFGTFDEDDIERLDDAYGR